MRTILRRPAKGKRQRKGWGNFIISAKANGRITANLWLFVASIGNYTNHVLTLISFVSARLSLLGVVSVSIFFTDSLPLVGFLLKPAS